GESSSGSSDEHDMLRSGLPFCLRYGPQCRIGGIESRSAQEPREKHLPIRIHRNRGVSEGHECRRAQSSERRNPSEQRVDVLPGACGAWECHDEFVAPFKVREEVQCEAALDGDGVYCGGLAVQPQLADALLMDERNVVVGVPRFTQSGGWVDPGCPRLHVV